MNLTDEQDHQPLDHVVVYADERLLATAASSLLQSRQVTSRATAVASTTDLLTVMRRRVDVAVVFDAVDGELADLFEALAHRADATPVLVVVEDADPWRIADLLELGAAGAIEKSCAVEVLCRAVLNTAFGRLVVPPLHHFEIMETLRQRRMLRYDARSRLAELSPRERRVLRDLTEGISISQSAEHMVVSVHTVRACIRRLGDKLGVHGQLRLAAVGRDLFEAAQTNSDLAHVSEFQATSVAAQRRSS